MILTARPARNGCSPSLRKTRVALSPDMENVKRRQVAVGFQLGGAGADGMLCPGIRTSRAGTLFTNKLSKGRQTAAGPRRLRALEIAQT